MRKAIPWFSLCWLLVALTLAAAVFHAPLPATGALYLAAAVAGEISAAYLEKSSPTIVSDFVWFVVPGALFLFPLALLMLSVRVIRIRKTFRTDVQAQGAP